MTLHTTPAANDAGPLPQPANAEQLAAVDAVRDKFQDVLTPGYAVPFDPEEAEQAGAFVEDALSERDAADSVGDAAAMVIDPSAVFLDRAGPSADIPAFITTTNARDLFGLQPGESVADAIRRVDAPRG